MAHGGQEAWEEWPRAHHQGMRFAGKARLSSAGEKSGMDFPADRTFPVPDLAGVRVGDASELDRASALLDR